MAVYPTKNAPATKPTMSAQAPEVTSEVTAPAPISASRPIIGIAPRPLFETVVEDAAEAPKVSVPHVRQMTAKTIAELAAGREMISQYSPAPE